MKWAIRNKYFYRFHPPTPAKDLRWAFPGMRGFFLANVWRMRQFQMVYSSEAILAQVVRELAVTVPCGHPVLLLGRIKSPSELSSRMRCPTVLRLLSLPTITPAAVWSRRKAISSLRSLVTRKSYRLPLRAKMRVIFGVAILSEKEMNGRLFFHMGDDSGFKVRKKS